MLEGTLNIHHTWLHRLQSEFKAEYFKNLNAFLIHENEKKTILPPQNLIFEAFNKTPFDAVKIVLLGQDPYPTPGDAHGLSFSVPKGTKIPKSLVNIYKELHSDLAINRTTGNLDAWATQGVLLLNTVLTVQAGFIKSHRNQGWEVFTKKVIQLLSSEKQHLVFILWGNDAKKLKTLINSEKHCIIESAHPSPLSSYRGFFGSKPFSKTNTYLKSKGIKTIDWSLA